MATLELAGMFVEVGYPGGVVNAVTGEGETGEALVAHPGVDKVAFTGSTSTGKAIARLAADHLARVSLGKLWWSVRASSTPVGVAQVMHPNDTDKGRELRADRARGQPAIMEFDSTLASACFKHLREA